MPQFSPIGSLLNDALRRTGVSDQVKATLVLDKFDELCQRKWGQKAKEQVHGVYIKNKILTIMCVNSVIAQEIQLRAHLFIKEINKKFGEVVERIKFLS